MALYSEKVMDHFTHPRNVGVIENADGVGEVGNAKCGDIMRIYLKIQDGIVEDVKFETFKRGFASDQQGGGGGLGRSAGTQDALFGFGGGSHQSGGEGLLR